MENRKIDKMNFFTKATFMENQFYRYPTHFVKMGHISIYQDRTLRLDQEKWFSVLIKQIYSLPITSSMCLLCDISPNFS